MQQETLSSGTGVEGTRAGYPYIRTEQERLVRGRHFAICTRCKMSAGSELLGTRLAGDCGT